MSHLKIKDLRSSDKNELQKKLAEFKKELSQLRVVQQVSGQAGRIARIGPIRKSIARILTVLNQNERENLRKAYSDKKTRDALPKSLKQKLTRRRRLALKDNEKNRKTRRQLRQAAKFPKRVFA
eukprot:CAMPEP_0204911004 /NCGR_PEP_ID=MMETSP1397-20131031/9434_1 /ASSEMBLY_ACC=CAM_ASM_000891 /TAXON_ID=49980 /ORGANISM="Climacostomum Climacostomum virens, Strain Stock W-24" /LENGTH=123 /DNA_ID=CAMNT_0052081387 /DNA_START=8 /DNA_END=376 /DNA_ORIENTATION=-